MRVVSATVVVGGEGEGKGPRLPLACHAAQRQHLVCANCAVRDWKGALGLPLLSLLQKRLRLTHQGVLRVARSGSESERD